MCIDWLVYRMITVFTSHSDEMASLEDKLIGDSDSEDQHEEEQSPVVETPDL